MALPGPIRMVLLVGQGAVFTERQIVARIIPANMSYVDPAEEQEKYETGQRVGPPGRVPLTRFHPRVPKGPLSTARSGGMIPGVIPEHYWL